MLVAFYKCFLDTSVLALVEAEACMMVLVADCTLASSASADCI